MNGKLILLWIAICVFTGSINAQGVPVTAIVDNRSVNVEHIAKLLNSKLNAALTDAGVHSESDRGLYLVGEVVPISEDIVDTGMKKIVIRKYNLSLRIEQPMLNMQFGLLEIPLEGAGMNGEKAVMEALRKFNPTSTSTQNFIVESITKADQYFVDNIANIIDKAEILAKSGDYDGGIALLWACPNLPSIHSEVYEAMNRLYTQKQNSECANILVKARTAYELKKYKEASSYLSEIDAESNCAEAASELSRIIGQEIRQTEKEEQRRADKEKELLFQAKENERIRAAELERKRISAIESVATAYFKTRSSINHYYVW